MSLHIAYGFAAFGKVQNIFQPQILNSKCNFLELQNLKSSFHFMLDFVFHSILHYWG